MINIETGMPLPTSTGQPVVPLPTLRPNPIHYEYASAGGVRTLWAIFAAMVVASGVLAFFAHRAALSARLLHVLVTIVTVTSALTYFAMATGTGSSLACGRVVERHDNVPDTDHVTCRQVFWSRWTDLVISTPLILAVLAAVSGLDGARTLVGVVADLVMIAAGPLAAKGARQHGGRYGAHSGGHSGSNDAAKWGWYAIGWLAFATVVWNVGYRGGQAARARGTKVTKVFTALAGYTFVLWIVYHFVWAAANGMGKLTVDQEIVSFAILDVLTKAGFAAGLLVALRMVPDANVEVGSWWSQGLAPGGRILLVDDDNA